MYLDPDHLKAAIFGFGTIRDEAGEIRWPVVIGGLIVAGGVAVSGFIVTMGNQISALAATVKILSEDVRELKTSLHPATSKRYTSDDAARDLELLRQRIKDSREESRRDADEIKRQIQRMEDRRR